MNNFFKGLAIGLLIALIITLFFIELNKQTFSEGIQSGKQAVAQYQVKFSTCKIRI